MVTPYIPQEEYHRTQFRQPIHHRPLEDRLIDHDQRAEELEALRAAIQKAILMYGKKEGPRSCAYFLANRLGMSQYEIAFWFGISQQAVSLRIRRFEYYVKIAYRR